MTASVPAPRTPPCIIYRPGWWPGATETFALLYREIAWQQRDITIFGRTQLTPRLTAWVGEGSYTYSGITHRPAPWPLTMSAIRDRLIAEFGVAYNSCLANLYRDGSDSMGWHSDNEPELGQRPTIASVNFGARRSFVLRHRRTKERWTYELGEGDLLIMRDESQEDYAHAVPKTARPVGPRINLTFRSIQPDQTVVNSSIAPAN
jgi:alkylated DNA repair dioxygenase AlkB